MEAINSAFRAIAGRFIPESNSTPPVVLNQSQPNSEKSTITWNDGMVSAFPDLGSDYTGSYLSTFQGVYTVPACVRCVQVLTDISARLPKYIVTNTDFPTKAKNHWGNTLFENLNPLMSNYMFWRYVFTNVFANGEQYIIIERDNQGFITHLTPAKFAGYVTSGIPDNPLLQLTVPDVYSLNSGGNMSSRIGQRQVLLSNVIHLTDGTYDPFRGRAVKPMQQKGRNPVGLYLAVLKRYEASLFLGGHAKNYLQATEDQWKRFSAMVKEEGYRGLFSALRTVPLPIGSTLIEAGKSHVESQTLEMLQFLIGEIARAWGVPLFMLYSDVQSGSSGKASRPDLAEQFINFVRSGYGTAAQAMESELNKKLLTIEDRKRYRIKFDLDSLTSGTMQQKAELAKNMVAAGIWTVNEGREYTGMAPMDGADVLRSPTGAPGDNQPIGDGNNDNKDKEGDENEEENAENMYKYSRINNIPNAYINSI